MPSKNRKDYVRLYEFGKPSCLFVKKDKIKNITEEQWKNAAEFGTRR
jgi:hypothetical protein